MPALPGRHGKLVMEWNLQKMDGPDHFFNHCEKELNIHEVHLLRTDVIKPEKGKTQTQQ